MIASVKVLPGQGSAGSAGFHPVRSWSLAILLAAATISSSLAGREPAEAALPDAPVKPLPVYPLVVPAAREDLPDALLRTVPVSVNDLRAIEAHVSSLAARVSPAVVAIRVGGASGSGVVVSADGLVLSVAHVGGYAEREVTFTFPDGRTARGVTLGSNHAMDSAVMRIIDPGPWPFAEVGDLRGVISGDWVLALGHPGGYQPERPVVVRLGRMIGYEGGLLRTDSTIISGDSGGPLFDMHGRVVGVHSRITDSPTANYHVPIGTYAETWERLAGGETWGQLPVPPRTWVGVSGVDHPEGIQLERIFENGPAFRAGLKSGDIVTKLNGMPVRSYATFLGAVTPALPGETITLGVKRADRELEVKLTVERRGSSRTR